MRRLTLSTTSGFVRAWLKLIRGLVRKALHRETRQAAADNSAAWQTWFHNALLGEFRGKDSPLVAGIAEFVSIYTGEKRAELRDELRREFEDGRRALEARCAALEQRLENVAQGRREKFAFAHTRSEFVLKH